MEFNKSHLYFGGKHKGINTLTKYLDHQGAKFENIASGYPTVWMYNYGGLKIEFYESHDFDDPKNRDVLSLSVSNEDNSQLVIEVLEELKSVVKL